MEKRVQKLEDHFDDMQKALYEVLANVKAINANINKAIDMEEKVIRLEERQKMTNERLKIVETENKNLRKDMNGINIKIAMYTGAIAIISFVVPYALNSLMN